jgi:hypothetical protein
LSQELYDLAVWKQMHIPIFMPMELGFLADLISTMMTLPSLVAECPVGLL